MFERPVDNPAQTFTNTANLAPPGFGQSFLGGALSSVIAPNAAIEDIGHAISGTPGEGWAQNALDYYNNQQNISGSSTAGNITGSTLGFLISPETGIVGKGLVEGGAKLLAAKELPRLGQAAMTSLKSGAAFSTAMAPYTIPDNYNSQNGSIDWGGVAKTLGVYQGIGMALPILPYAAGVVAGKVKSWRAAGAVAPEAEAAAEAPASGVAQPDLDAAKEAGSITPEEHAFMTSLNTQAPIDSNLVKTVADTNGVDYSQSGHVDVPLATGEDLQNIQKTAPDELAAAAPDTTPDAASPMSNHILNSRLSDIAQNQQMLDGLQGYADHMDRLGENKDAYLDSIDNAMDTTAGIDRDHPLSQDSLFQAAHDEPIERSNLPKEVQDALAHEDKINQAAGTVSRRESQLSREGLSNADIQARQERLESAKSNLSDLESSRPSLLSPDEELGALRKRLLNGDDLNILEKLSDKQRLDDLAHVSEGARNLRDRVDLEEQYQKQAAISTVAKAVVQKANNGIDMAASNRKTLDYLQNRVQQKVQKFSDEAKPKLGSPEDWRSLDDFDSIEKEAATPETKTAVNKLKAKSDEIDAEQNTLTNMLNCAMGIK